MTDVKTVADLKHDPENARIHNERNLAMIAASLDAVGAARSIVIDENNVVLAGNGVLDAAVRTGIERVQVIDADGETIIAVRRVGLTSTQKIRLALFDNRTAEIATWSADQILADEELHLLDDIFTPQELGDLFALEKDNLLSSELEKSPVWIYRITTDCDDLAICEQVEKLLSTQGYTSHRSMVHA